MSDGYFKPDRIPPILDEIPPEKAMELIEALLGTKLENGVGPSESVERPGSNVISEIAFKGTRCGEETDADYWVRVSYVVALFNGRFGPPDSPKSGREHWKKLVAAYKSGDKMRVPSITQSMDEFGRFTFERTD